MEVARDQIVDLLDDYLRIDAVSDASVNGLQVEGADRVSRLGVAVDVCAETIAIAARTGCQMLLVHHGLFWGKSTRLVGAVGVRVGACYSAGLSVYAAHLPLDLHPELGNNVLLARELGGTTVDRFGMVDGVRIGIVAELAEPVSLARIAGRLAVTGSEEPLLWAFGADLVRRLGVITGSGASALEEAIDADVDCFVTGEPRHAAYHTAREAGVNCLFGGHYATETHGVRAVGELIAERFGIETQWIDHPTGV